MVVDNKATVSYVRVLKEDLAIFRIKPSDGPVPDFKAGQFVTLGLHIPSGKNSPQSLFHCFSTGAKEAF
jgi:ferredoxin--NADP+ reductase